MCEALTFLLDNIYLRFGTKLFRQIVGIPMVPIGIAHPLWLICSCFVMKETMMSLSVVNQSEIIEAFSSTSRYVDDLLNI